MFCTFWLGNVLRATTACTFSSLIWPDGSAPAALASLLFDPPEPQIIGKNTVFRDFPTFSRICIFFLLTTLFYHLLSSTLLGSLTSKLPSTSTFTTTATYTYTCTYTFTYTYTSTCMYSYKLQALRQHHVQSPRLRKRPFPSLKIPPFQRRSPPICRWLGT